METEEQEMRGRKEKDRNMDERVCVPFTISWSPQLNGAGTFLQMPESIIPGCKQLAVTLVPSSLRASSRVKHMFAYLDT